MVTLFGLLNIAARGLSASQAGLNTTGQNITNVNTEGYSRQRIDQRAVDPLIMPNGAYGQGVDVISVERLRDMFLESQIRGVKSDTAYHEELNQIYNQIETILQDPLTPINETDATSGGGINQLLSQFFQSLNRLTLSPESTEIRTTVIESADSLSETFNYTDQQLISMRNELNNQVSQLVTQVNEIIDELAQLNQKIASVQVGEQIQANDLLDRRDKLLLDLADIAPITTTQTDNGQVNVSIAGQRVVDGVSAKRLILDSSQVEDNSSVYHIRAGENGFFEIDESIQNGKLGAVLAARDRIVPGLQQDLDELARGIIYEVNSIHCGASGTEGYSNLQSQFHIPVGAEQPDTTTTLQTIFNTPRRSIHDVNSVQPYPVKNGEFSIRVADAEQNTQGVYTVKVNTQDTLYDLVNRIDRCDGIVSSIRSTLTFNPVYVKAAKAKYGAAADEIGNSLGSLSAAQGTPISEVLGSYSFEIHLQDGAGNAVDTDPATIGVDPIVVTFTSAMTMVDLANQIQSAGQGYIKANLIPGEGGEGAILQIAPNTDGMSLSIQNDNSGLIKAFGFLLTDPNTPLIGGNTTRIKGSFSGAGDASFLGTGNPQFSPAFPGPPPSVISTGSFDFVVIDGNNNPTVHTIQIESAGIDTMQELAAAIQAADADITATVAADNKLVISAANNRSFFFQNDTTGLISALGFDGVSGYGELGNQSFTEGSFEIVVADESGTVTHIMEVPILADPSKADGIFSLGDLVRSINARANEVGAPIRAAIVPDAKNPSQSQILIESDGNHEFTFRSDDSHILAALGFTDGPVLQEAQNNPINNASSTLAVGDNIGGMVRARLTDQGIEISALGDSQFSFVGDNSRFLAAAGINGLFTGYDSGSMGVNSMIKANNALLAASKDGSKGNNEAALALVDLENQPVLNGQTLGEAYRSTLTDLGTASSKATQFLETNQSVLTELKALQEQNSGVSLDEESISLIRYQRAYQASARVISTIDQLLSELISNMGA